MTREKTVPEIIAQAKRINPEKMDEARERVSAEIAILKKIKESGRAVSYTEADLAEELLFVAMEIIDAQ